MFKIQLLNKIATVGLDLLPRDDYEYASEIVNPDAVLVRSQKMHDMEMPSSMKAIARAGAGVNNIPVDECSAQGIVVFNSGARAEWANVSVSGVSGVSFPGWTITGGVTIHGGQVRITDSRIVDSTAEDALNLIGTSFELENVDIARTASDAVGRFDTNLFDLTDLSVAYQLGA